MSTERDEVAGAMLDINDYPPDVVDSCQDETSVTVPAVEIVPVLEKPAAVIDKSEIPVSPPSSPCTPFTQAKHDNKGTSTAEHIDLLTVPTNIESNHSDQSILGEKNPDVDNDKVSLSPRARADMGHLSTDLQHEQGSEPKANSMSPAGGLDQTALSRGSALTEDSEGTLGDDEESVATVTNGKTNTPLCRKGSTEGISPPGPSLRTLKIVTNFGTDSQDLDGHKRADQEQTAVNKETLPQMDPLSPRSMPRQVQPEVQLPSSWDHHILDAKYTHSSNKAPRAPRFPNPTSRPACNRYDIDREQAPRLEAQLKKAKEDLEVERSKAANLRETLAKDVQRKTEAAFSGLVGDLLKKQIEVVDLKGKLEAKERDLNLRERFITQFEEWLCAGQEELYRKRGEANSYPHYDIDSEFRRAETNLHADQCIEKANVMVQTEMEKLRLKEEALELREKQYKIAIREEMTMSKVEPGKMQPAPAPAVKLTERPSILQPVTFTSWLNGTSTLTKDQPVPAYGGSPAAAMSIAKTKGPIASIEQTAAAPNVTDRALADRFGDAGTGDTLNATTNTETLESSFVKGYAACHRVHTCLADLRTGLIKLEDPHLAFLFDAGHPENPFTMGVNVGKMDKLGKGEEVEVVKGVAEEAYLLLD